MAVFLHHTFLHRNLVPQFNSFPKKFSERIVFIKTSGETGSTKLGQPATKIAQGANSCQIKKFGNIKTERYVINSFLQIPTFSSSDVARCCVSAVDAYIHWLLYVLLIASAVQPLSVCAEFSFTYLSGFVKMKIHKIFIAY